jgi:hypothetical protein
MNHVHAWNNFRHSKYNIAYYFHDPAKLVFRARWPAKQAKIEYIPPKSFEDRNNKSDHRERVSTMNHHIIHCHISLNPYFLWVGFAFELQRQRCGKWCQTRRTSSGRSSSRCLELEDNWLLERAG